jgi:Raf kinase inhibitor-like YbhB/YbcL family protein
VGTLSGSHHIYRQPSIIKDDLRGSRHYEYSTGTEESETKGKLTHRATLLIMIMIFPPSCGGGSHDAPTGPREEPKGVKMAIEVRSSAFEDGGVIPARYTCDGQDLTPPLSWDSVPNGTKSLALTVDDPDAPRGTFVHWMIYDLPPDTRRLPEDVPKRRTLSGGVQQGVNGAGGIGYTGPCPPGGTHRYLFKIYALDTRLDLGGGATIARLSDAMEGHVLAEGQLMGTYRRR